MRPAERQQYSSTAQPGQRGQDSVLRNWAPRGQILRYKIGAIGGSTAGADPAEPASQALKRNWCWLRCSALMSETSRFSYTRSERGGCPLVHYYLLHTRSQALAPVIVVVRWPPMHEVWPPRRAFVLAVDLPQHRKSHTAAVDKQRTRG